MEVELIRFRKKMDFIHVYFCEARNSKQYGSPNETLDSCCQTVYIVISLWSHLSDIVHHLIEWCADEFRYTVEFTEVLYADKRIVNIMKVYIDGNNLQLEYIQYSKTMSC